METIKEVLMIRDNMTSQEADEQIKDATAEMNDLLSQGQLEEASNICLSWWGLEPDYLLDLVNIKYTMFDTLSTNLNISPALFLKGNGTVVVIDWACTGVRSFYLMSIYHK